MSDEVRDVCPERWVETITRVRDDEGFGWFDSVTAVDEVGRPREGVEMLRVVVRLEDKSGRGVRLQTLVPRDRPEVDSLAGVFPGAVWHEREVHDFFGVTFVGGDDRPLLWHQPAGVPVVRPLLKDAVLAARTAQAWPGAKEPGDAGGSRRRMAPAGVPDPAVWGDRPAGDPSPLPDEVAAEVTGGRVRRRR